MPGHIDFTFGILLSCDVFLLVFWMLFLDALFLVHTNPVKKAYYVEETSLYITFD